MRTFDDLDRELAELEQYGVDAWSNIALVQKIKAVRLTAREAVRGARAALKAAQALRPAPPPPPPPPPVLAVEPRPPAALPPDFKPVAVTSKTRWS